MENIEGFEITVPLDDHAMSIAELRAAHTASQEAIAGISVIIGRLVREGTEEQLELWKTAQIATIHQSGQLGRRWRQAMHAQGITEPPYVPYDNVDRADTSVRPVDERPDDQTSPVTSGGLLRGFRRSRA